MDMFARSKACRRMDIRYVRWMDMTPTKRALVIFALLVIWPFLFCEYLIYPLVIWRCRWPDHHSPHGEAEQLQHSHQNTVMAMILSDTHLLGPRKGHWFDKLRREWQMKRSFQTAVASLQPEVIFVTGDLFDEGEFAHDHEMDVFTTRFHDLFALPPGTRLHAAVGNHDIGFHYSLNLDANYQFQDAFGQGGVRMVVIKGMPFVLVNSMAMHGDGCTLCAEAEQKLRQINRTLACALDPTNGQSCASRPLQDYVRPVLLQHFPLYRRSDGHCPRVVDGPSDDDRRVQFRPGWECVSANATAKLVAMLRPRAAFSGHIHFACETRRSGRDGFALHDPGSISADPDSFVEYNVASFNWRNLNTPAFLLARFTPDAYQVSKCYLPRESTVFGLYAVAGLMLVIYVLVLFCTMLRGGRTTPYKRS